MNITFVLLSLDIAGGVRTVFELSNELAQRGHRIKLVHCAIEPWNKPKLSLHLIDNSRKVYRFLRSIIYPKDMKWFVPLFSETIKIPTLRACHFPDGDIIIATVWPTAEEVFKADDSKGKKYYFIQGYETWCGPKERVKKTYSLPLNRIVISSFLKNVLKDEIGVESQGPVFMGVNINEFNRNGRSLNNFNRIGMLYNKHPLKGVEDGLKAFEIAREKHPDIKLVMFGRDKTTHTLPKYVEYHQNVPRYELKRIYGSCSIWLVPSRSEGYCLIPMEAMACGCALISTRIGGIDDYAIPGETALVCEPGDVEGLSAHLIKLLDDRNEIINIAERGFQHIQRFTWDRAADEFLKCIKS